MAITQRRDGELAYKQPELEDGRLAPVLIVGAEPTSLEYRRGLVMSGQGMRLFAETAKSHGLRSTDFAYVMPCAPIPDEISESAAKVTKHLARYRDEVLTIIEQAKPLLIVTLGANSLKQVAGKSQAITKKRGKLQHYDNIPCPVLPVFSPSHVLRMNEYHDIFVSDMAVLGKLKNSNWDIQQYELDSAPETNYFWCMDLQFLLDSPPPSLAFDCEATGLKWYDPEIEILTVQLTWEAGTSAVVPLHREYYPDLTEETRNTLIQQLKELLENPDIMKAGHNLKFDVHMVREKLGVYPTSCFYDTMNLAFTVDDNMRDKSLDECVRRWVPVLAGANDSFNQTIDKSRMIDVDHDSMLQYSGTDTDMTFRLAKVLVPLAEKDKLNYRVFEKVITPAINSFQDYVEPVGLPVSTAALSELQQAMNDRHDEMYGQLMALVPRKVKRKHLDDGKELKFTRHDFVRDILFSADGYNLKPKMFTPATEKLPPAERIPSTNAKQHLVYFEDNEFVRLYREYSQISKMITTYVGVPEDENGNPTGFWKYIHNNKIHPSYWLSRTVTGRCLTGDAKVVTSRGVMTMLEIGEWYQDWQNTTRTKTQSDLLVLTHNNRLKPVTDFICNGRKRVYEITTNTGHTIQATSNHPFWTANGWVTLAELSVGDEVLTHPVNYEHDPEPEIWRDIPWAENYRVSSHGRIWFKGTEGNPDNKHSTPHPARFVKPYRKGKWGHVKVRLGRGTKDTPVHRLVCRVFHGEPQAGQEVCHLNGLPADNRAANLRWGTSQDNGNQAKAQGRTPSGRLSTGYVLSSIDEEAIRQAHALGYSSEHIAQEQGVSSRAVRKVIHGERVGDKSVLVPSVISSKTKIGRRETYDITVEDDHSFIANQFAVHNTASSDPNGQNIPKRGALAKAYRKVFQAPAGYVFCSADYSQAELRIVAWMANDPTMIEIYRKGGDIHAATAAQIIGLSYDVFERLRKSDKQATLFVGKITGLEKWLDTHCREANIDPETVPVSDYMKVKRQQAKAVNFGFVFGMGWRTFQTYAKTDYGVEFTEKESQDVREAFFRLYSRLTAWHKKQRKQVRTYGYVRALHGAIRRLPSIESSDEAIQSQAERNAINCLSDDTEILTKDGWKTVDGLSVGEDVFTVNNRGRLELNKVEAVNQGYVENQTMLNYETGSVSCIATKSHRWLVDYYGMGGGVSKGETVITTMKTSTELSDYGDHKIWLCGDGYRNADTTWTDDEIELMGWVLTDGHYIKQRSKKTGRDMSPSRVGVTQTKPQNLDRIHQLFTRLGKHGHYITKKTGQNCWSISCDTGLRIRQHMPEKTLTMGVLLSMSHKQRVLLYKTMLLGDGCFDARTQSYRVFCSGSEERANAFLMLCQLIGQPAHADYRDMSKAKFESDKLNNVPKTKGAWLVTIKQRKRAQSGYGKNWITWSGRVWCPTVKNETWIAKRNGRVFVTGNSPVQRFASDLGLISLARLTRDCPVDQTGERLIKPVAFIHDDLVCLVKEEYAEQAARYIKWYNENPPLYEWFALESPVPFKSDVEIGVNLGEMEERPDIQAVRPPWFDADADHDFHTEFDEDI